MADKSDDYSEPHIKESRVGTFTEQATKHHEGVQEFAHHILANPGDYSKHEREKAQFAVNSTRWKH